MRFARRVAISAVAACSISCAVTPRPEVAAPPVPPPSPWVVADERALSAPARRDWSVRELSSYLTEGLSTDEERVRALFRWMTANVRYDLAGFRAGGYGDLSPEAVLRGRSAVCEGYASLFEALARQAGLEAVTVLGFAKGVGYDAEAPLSESFNHAWNAVRIGETWKLVDCTWGAGSLDERGQYVAEFDPFYFFTPPDRFVYSHLPQDPRWQLLEHPISREAFAALPLVKPAFFQCGLRFQGEVTGPLAVTGPLVRVPVVLPEGVSAKASILRGNEPLGEGFARTLATPGDRRLEALAPEPGTYTIRVFAAQGERTATLDWALDLLVTVATGSGGRDFKALDESDRKGSRPKR